MESGAKSCLKEPGGAILHYKIRVSYPGPLVLVPDTFHTDVRVATTGHPAQTIELAIPAGPWNRPSTNSSAAGSTSRWTSPAAPPGNDLVGLGLVLEA